MLPANRSNYRGRRLLMKVASWPPIANVITFTVAMQGIIAITAAAMMSMVKYSRINPRKAIAATDLQNSLKLKVRLIIVIVVTAIIATATIEETTFSHLLLQY